MTSNAVTRMRLQTTFVTLFAFKQDEHTLTRFVPPPETIFIE